MVVTVYLFFKREKKMLCAKMVVQVSRNTKTFEKKQVLKKSLQGLLLCSWYTIHHLSHRHFQYNTELFSSYPFSLFLLGVFPLENFNDVGKQFCAELVDLLFFVESIVLLQSFVTTNQKRLNQTDKSFQKMLMFFSASFSNFIVYYTDTSRRLNQNDNVNDDNRVVT